MFWSHDGEKALGQFLFCYIEFIDFSGPSIWMGKLALAATAPTEEGTLHVEIRDTDIKAEQE